MAAIDEIRRQEGRRQRPSDLLAARAALRGQIARLERELGQIVVAAYPPLEAGPRYSLPAGPRRLSFGDLERVRDALAGRLGALRAAAADQAARQAQARHTLQRMLADPPAHRRRRVSNEDLGRPGCAVYRVGPKAGVLGMLMGWWEVKLSSGCPLAALTA